MKLAPLADFRCTHCEWRTMLPEETVRPLSCPHCCTGTLEKVLENPKRCYDISGIVYQSPMTPLSPAQQNNLDRIAHARVIGYNRGFIDGFFVCFFLLSVAAGGLFVWFNIHT